MKKREAHRVARKLGFEERKGKEIQYQYRHAGVIVATTAVPKGKGELYVANQFRQQLRLDQRQLASAIKCPFGAIEYEQHLAEIGIIEPE